MSTLNDSDALVVSINGLNYQIRNDQMSTVNDTDLFLVERAGTQYQVTGADLKVSFEPTVKAPVLSSVALSADSSNVNRFTDADYDINLVLSPEGFPVSAKSLKAEVRGQLAVTGETSEIVSVNPPKTLFSTTLYTGNDGDQTITNGIDLAGEGGLVWSKLYDQGFSHALVDTVRGVGNVLVTNMTDGQVSGPASVKGFNADGYLIGADTYVNSAPYGYASWCFLKAPKFFDIQTYVGDKIAGKKISHALTSVPGAVIVKDYDNGSAWRVYHKDLGPTQSLFLSSDQKGYTSTSSWADTAPTLIDFTVGDDDDTNKAGGNFVAYLFADEPGRIKCGSYVGAGEQTVDVGFTPGWVMIKNTTENADWIVVDNKRTNADDTYSYQIFPNRSDAQTPQTHVEFLPTGWKYSVSGLIPLNNNGNTYIYVAIAANTETDSSLTLASSEGLTNGGFLPGDLIQQDNSPMVPRSSAITDVNNITAVAASITWSGGAGVSGGVVYGYGFDGSNNASQADLVASYTTSGSAIAFKVSNWPASGTGIEIAPSSDTLQGGRVILQEGTGTTFDQVVVIPVTAGTGYVYLRLLASEAGAQYNIDLAAEVPPESTVLTLRNSNGLGDFEVGDSVQESVTGSYLKDTEPPAGLKDLFVTDANTQRDWDLFVANQASAFSFAGNTYLSFPAGTSITFDYVSASGGTFTFAFGSPTTIALSGDVNNAGDQSVTGDTSGSPSDIFIQLQSGHGQFTLTAANTCYLYGRSIFGTFGEVKITAIDSLVPDVTTDGGAWSVDQAISGPSKPVTATFVSADPSVPSMTVSDLTGPWSASTGNYAINTVTNPVLVTPKTSAISAVTELLMRSGIPSASNITSSTSLGQITLPPAGTLYSIRVSIEEWQLASYMQFGFSKPDSRWSDAAYNSRNNGLYQFSDFPIAEFNGGLGTGPAAGSAGQGMKYASDDSSADWLGDANSGSAQFIYDSSGNVWLKLNDIYVYSNTINKPAVFNPRAGLAGNPMWTGLDSTYFFGYLTRAQPSYPSLTVDGTDYLDSFVLALTDYTDLDQFAVGDSVYVADFAQSPFFSTTLYSGNQADDRQILTGVDNTSKSLVWIKVRTTNDEHVLVSGDLGMNEYGTYNWLASNTAGSAIAGYAGITSLDSNGFRINQPSTAFNSADNDYVAWNFKAAPKFFDVQKFVGTGQPGNQISHDLEADVGMMIIKSMDTTDTNWQVWHKDLGNTATAVAELDSIDQRFFNGSVWSSTPPTSTHFTVGQSSNSNTEGYDMIAYLFADTPGLIRCGGYVGTGNAGLEVTTGFETQWLLIKRVTGAEDWVIFDTARGWTDTVAEMLAPNSPAEESPIPGNIAPTSTGFITLSGGWTAVNASGEEYIYVAIAKDAFASPPSGTLSSIAGLDMTLSNVTPPWEVGQQVTMDQKEAVVSRLYCELDTLGNVKELLTTDPGYVEQASNSAGHVLSFPTEFTSGFDPDTALPPGTSLKVFAKAENPMGYSEGESATIFP